MTKAEIVRGMQQAFLRRDLAAAMAPFHPDVEWDARSSPLEEFRDVYSGPEGTARMWRQWLEAWESIEGGDLKIAEAGDRVFMWIEGQVNRGRASGIGIEMPPYGWVFTFDDGLIVRAAIFGDRQQALAAAGIA